MTVEDMRRRLVLVTAVCGSADAKPPRRPDGSKHQSPYTDLQQCHSWRVGFNADLNSRVFS
jgi:hypothetical protein